MALIRITESLFRVVYVRSSKLVAMSGLQAIDRRERLRRLALETIDLSKDPYFMRNHLGQYECRLCLTLHTNEGNYLAHTQVSRVAGRWLPTACSVGAAPLVVSCAIKTHHTPVVKAHEAQGQGQWGDGGRRGRGRWGWSTTHGSQCAYRT